MGHLIHSQLTVPELSVRVLCLNDAAKMERQSWIASIFEQIDLFQFDDEDTRCISLAFADYDLLMLSGNDAMRMVRFIRINRKIVNRKIKICVMSDSHPRRRAALLAAGFDDVFDTSRQQPQEAVARIRAIQRRYDMIRDVEAKANDRIDRLAALADPQQLTPRESEILGILLESPTNFVRYSTLISKLSTPKRQISMSNLKVSMSKIRSKLVDGVKLSAYHNTGYELQIPAKAGNALKSIARKVRTTVNDSDQVRAMIPNDFIAHDGGPCPVRPDSMPGVILRRGDRFERGEVAAVAWDWVHLGDGSDVIAYKPELDAN